MKKLFLLAALLLGTLNALATKVFSDLGAATAVGNATWEAGTRTFAWTKSSYAFMVLPGLSGDLTDYTSLVIEAEGLTASSSFRVDFVLADEGSTTLSRLAGTQFYSAGVKTVGLASVLTPEQRAMVRAIRVNTNSEAGQVAIKRAYLVKPMQLAFDDNGQAVVSVSDLTATGGLTLDAETGELTCDGTAGTLSIDFPSEGVDLSGVTGFAINRTGDAALFSNFVIANATGGWSKGFWSSVYGRSDLAQHLTSATCVNSWVWNGNGTAGTNTISSIVLTANVLAATDGHVTPLTSAQFHGWTAADATGTVATENVYGACALNTPTALPYGSSNVDWLSYADLSAYDRLVVKVSAGTPRFCFNRTASGGQDNADEAQSEMIDIPSQAWGTERYQAADGQTYTIDLARMVQDKGFAHLHCIKGANWQDVTVTELYLYKDAPVADYILTGSGTMTASAKAALADASATVYDASGVSGDTPLTPANPNALVLVGSSPAWTSGVNAVSTSAATGGYTAEAVALRDGWPFRAPFAVATPTATYTRTVASGGYATAVLPFAIAVPSEGVAVYRLAGVDDNEMTFAPVAAGTPVAANTPFLYKPTAGADVTFAGADIRPTTTDFTRFAAGIDGWWAAQAMDEQVIDDVSADPRFAGFSVYAISGGEFVRCTGRVTTKPFRAFFLRERGGAAKERYAISIADGEATPVGIATADGGKDSETYSLTGQRVSSPARGINIVRRPDGTSVKTLVR